MGTGVMIGAGIFALTGQIAELAGPLFPLSFVIGALVTAFSAYTRIKASNAYLSAGGSLGRAQRLKASRAALNAFLYGRFRNPDVAA